MSPLCDTVVSTVSGLSNSTDGQTHVANSFDVRTNPCKDLHCLRQTPDPVLKFTQCVTSVSQPCRAVMQCLKVNNKQPAIFQLPE